MTSTLGQVATRLSTVLGASAVLAGDDLARQSVGIWSRGRSSGAEVVVRPASTEEVASVLALCQAERQPVVVHGGLTGLVGATEVRPGELVLSLERLCRIEEIDVAGHTMLAGAGVRLQAAQEAALAAGLLLPLDMGSRGTAMLGGVAATNAGGNRVLRYGMARALVLGLEGVLPDGTVVRSLNRMMKNNAGFDLKQLFIGAEGALGVITRLVLRLYPRPASRQTAMVAVPDFPHAVALLNLLDTALAGSLSAYEVMWQEFYRYMVAPATGRQAPLPPTDAFYVLIEAEGGEAASDDERFERILGEAAGRGLVADAVIAKSERERNALWEIRDDVVRLTELEPMFLFDVSAPLGSMEAYVDAVRAAIASDWPESRFFSFGHLADGNLHFAISAGRRGGEDKAAIERRVYEPLAAIGGSISAEHGIGIEKKQHLGICRTEAEIALMRTLKRALDPAGILNPGRVVDVG